MSENLEFAWIDSFARIPDTPSGRANGRTHGVAVSRDSNVIVFHQAENALLTFDATGHLRSAVGGDRWLGAHGLTLMREGGAEYLWLTDQASGEVVKVTLQGETVQTLARAPHAAYAGGGRYSPTWAAQNPDNGDIWVADGYGSSLVHRYSRDGVYPKKSSWISQDGSRSSLWLPSATGSSTFPRNHLTNAADRMMAHLISTLNCSAVRAR